MTGMEWGPCLQLVLNFTCSLLPWAGFTTRSQQAKARQQRLVLCKLARVERTWSAKGQNLLTEEYCSAQGAVRDIRAGQQRLAEG